jgi:hypothetical protein
MMHMLGTGDASSCDCGMTHQGLQGPAGNYRRPGRPMNRDPVVRLWVVFNVNNVVVGQ